MNKSKFLIKCCIYGIAWFLILSLGAFLISITTSYLFGDILFVEGLILLCIGFMLSVKGNPMGLSMQGLSQLNSQYMANENLETTKIERNILEDSVKNDIKFYISNIVLIIGGVISILISYFLF